MTLQDFLRTVWFGRWLVVVSVLAALGGAWYYLSNQEPVYAAEATVQLVDTETLSSAGLRLDTDPALAVSDDVASAAATALGDPTMAGELQADAVGEYMADDPNVVDLTVVDETPSEATDKVNALAAAYTAELKSQYDDDIAAMQSRLDALATSIDQQQAAVNAQAAASPTGVAGGVIEAQYSASMDQYQTLSAQVAQAQLLGQPAAIRQNSVSAQLASTPSALVYLIALLGGTLLGVGLAVVRRGLDTKVRTVGSARRAAGAPVLARLSGTSAALRAAERSGDLPVAIRSATAFTQSIRELRTALQAAVESEDGAVLVVTSADLDTPRSFVAANLAASWALSGRSVVALSGDLRQPRLNGMLPADPTAVAAGVTPPRSGGSRARTAVVTPVPTAIPHLSIYPALRTELDPADYLASDEVRDLIARLRADADVVIIDAPPMLVAADATILGVYADGVVLASTIGQAQIVAIEESADRLRAANAQLLGIALDGEADGRRSTYAAATYTFHGDAVVEADAKADANPSGPADVTGSTAGGPADAAATPGATVDGAQGDDGTDRRGGGADGTAEESDQGRDQSRTAAVADVL